MPSANDSQEWPSVVQPLVMEPAVVSSSTQPSASQHLFLQVLSNNISGGVIFRLKYCTPLGRLKRAYASRVQMIVGELRFTYDGLRFADGDTPMSLDMQDEDIIEIHRERHAGGTS